MKILKKHFHKEINNKLKKEKKTLFKELAFANFGMAFMLIVFSMSHYKRDSFLMVILNVVFVGYTLYLTYLDIQTFRYLKKEEKQKNQE